MKKAIFAFALLLTGQLNAQVTVKEPEFVGEVTVLTSDSEGISLEKEKCSVKAKSGKLGKIASFVPVPGASLVATAASKMQLTVNIKGDTAAVWVNPGEVRFIVRVKDQDINPKDYLKVIRFEQKKKERYCVVATATLFGGTETGVNESEKFTVERYGKKSFLITLKDVEPGQYGVSTNEFDGARTFGVK